MSLKGQDTWIGVEMPSVHYMRHSKRLSSFIMYFSTGPKNKSMQNIKPILLFCMIILSNIKPNY